MDAIIELDTRIPWEPPAASPRARARRPWIVLVAVALLAAGTLVAAVPRAGIEPVFTFAGFRVGSVETGGGRLIAERYHSMDTGTQVEVLRLRDGTRLWSMTLEPGQHLTFLTDNVMALTTDVPVGSTGALTVLDAGTGEPLWQRPQVAYLAQSGGRIVAEDLAGVAEESPVAEAWQPGETPLNVVPEQRSRHYLAFDEHTGATVWEVRVPQGSAVDFSQVGGSAGPTFMSELSPAGLLQIRDAGTGRVVATDQLDWSGTIASFAMGSSFRESGSALPEQVLLAKGGERGTDVYDRRSGRLLWRWEAARSSAWGGMGLYPCAVGLYCLGDASGLTAIDARTGERRWHAAGYNGVLGGDGDILDVRSGRSTGNAGPPRAAVDVRTGRVAPALTGWQLAAVVPGRGVVAWKSGDNGTALLAAVDPHSGRFTVFGRPAGWYGNADCRNDRDMLACVADGALSVWKLP
ncbi:PQQ-binding-like beta-propeller repeat protein [Dactylosporangium sp. NPDC000521]|uniref:outer membrane protein assembly factor BamB family protein n=1 Tax=Dactylosporangium sp. NPDC000521 TaxID=3363975 RepID=UPI0036A3CF07